MHVGIMKPDSDLGPRIRALRLSRQLSLAEVAAGTLDPSAINDALISSRLDTADLPDPDLVIRTSGETRTSNFLPWQAAYAEYEFTQTLWPDFTPQHLADIVARFGNRDRRFGGVVSA